MTQKRVEKSGKTVGGAWKCVLRCLPYYHMKQVVKWINIVHDNVLNFFCCNYVTIGVTSVKIIGKCINSNVDYTKESFITFAKCVDAIKLFWSNCIAIGVTSVKITWKHADTGAN